MEPWQRYSLDARAARLSRIPERRYFNWAGGIKATNENHLVASMMFRRMAEAFEKPSVYRKLAGEGMGLAMEVRTKLVYALHGHPWVAPGKERNIILGNSTTLALLPVLYSLAYDRDHYHGLFDQTGYAPMLSLLSSRNGRVSLPGIEGYEGFRFSSDDQSKAWRSSNLTTQNFGQNPGMGPACRGLPNALILDLWSRARESYTNFCNESYLINKSCFHLINPDSQLSQALYRCSESGSKPLLICDLVDGWGESAIGFGNALDAVRYLGGFSILDVSHVFGVRPILPDYCADVLLGSSSKYFGAEPTIGFAYVSDEILDLIIRNYLRKAPFPRIGFQFHPDVLKEAGCKGGTPDGIFRLPYWMPLPELESFRNALQNLGNFGIRMKNDLNASKANVAIRSFIRSLKSVGFIGTDATQMDYNQPSHGRTRYNFRAEKDGFGISFFYDPLVPFTVITLELPGSGRFRRSSLPWNAKSAYAKPLIQGLHRYMAFSGYLVHDLSERLTLFDHEDIFGRGLSIRVSWSPFVKADFEGFFQNLVQFISHIQKRMDLSFLYGDPGHSGPDDG